MVSAVSGSSQISLTRFSPVSLVLGVELHLASVPCCSVMVYHYREASSYVHVLVRYVMVFKVLCMIKRKCTNYGVIMMLTI